MEYKKPEFIAQNSAEGSFAAGCPVYDSGTNGGWTPGNDNNLYCSQCERAQ